MDDSLCVGDECSNSELTSTIDDSRKQGLKSRLFSSLKKIRDGAVGVGADEGLRAVETESDVGILEYIQDTTASFTGLLKYRWSDFVVVEIDMAGNLVELSDSKLPVEEKPLQAFVEKPKHISEDIWQDLAKMNAGESTKDHQVRIMVEDLTKQQRTEVHMTIKSAFPVLISNTATLDNSKCIVVHECSSKMHKADTFRNHRIWPKDRPKFLHFCLRKKSVDTFRALSDIARALRMRAGQLTVAGTKDARAITHQKVSVKQVSAERLVRAMSSPGCSRLSVGDFSYEHEALRLGDLSGNRFSIALRNISCDSCSTAQDLREIIALRVRCFAEHGFINYFGLQRFGSGSLPTHAIGRAVLQSRWSQAVDYILSSQLPRSCSVPSQDTDVADSSTTSNDADRMRAAQHIWRSERDASLALAQLTRGQQNSSIEGRILNTLSRLRTTACREALDALPAGARLLYVHAYQSWVWNRAATLRLKRSREVLPGDLVFAYSSKAGCDCPESTDYGDVESEGVTAETTSVRQSSAITDDANLPGTESSIKANSGVRPRLPEVIVLKEDEVENYTLRDVVIPLPGWAVVYPENETADDIRKMLADDQVQFSEQMKVSMPQYNTAGAYRRLLCVPGKVDWRLTFYNDPDADLLPADFHEGDCQTSGGDEARYRALLLQFNLSASSYATMAVREITGYDSSLKSQLALNEQYRKTFQDSDQRRISSSASRPKRSPQCVANVVATEPLPTDNISDHKNGMSVTSSPERQGLLKRPIGDSVCHNSKFMKS